MVLQAGWVRLSLWNLALAPSLHSLLSRSPAGQHCTCTLSQTSSEFVDSVPTSHYH